MSTPKRKFIEYHDPDYPVPADDSPLVDSKKIKLQFSIDSGDGIQQQQQQIPKPTIDGDDKIKKVQQIIKNEFQKELQLREKEINQIEHKLIQAKRLLQRVRYAIVFNFYTKKNLEFTENEIKNYPTQLLKNTTIDGNGNDNNNFITQLTEQQQQQKHEQPSLVESITSNLPIQKPIHPSLKKLLGKKPLDYNEILKIRSPRQAAKMAKTTISEKLRSKKDERKLKSIQQAGLISHQPPLLNNQHEIKIPRYVEPTITEKGITKINTARGQNQTRHLICVGNTSKYIGDEESVQGVTHKWLVYVKTKTTNVNEIKIDNILSKVRFFLHPSYKPNDVVEINCAPFQISRRGWGEFPIRAQLYFQSYIQQKPIQVIHNLILDKGHTGLQTMGAESVLEIWLNLPNNQIEIKQTQEIKIAKKQPILENISPLKLFTQPTTTTSQPPPSPLPSLLHQSKDLIVKTNSKICDTLLKIDNQNKTSENNTKIVQIEKKEESISINNTPKIINKLVPTKLNANTKNPLNQQTLQKNQTIIKFPPTKPNRKFIKCLNTTGKVTIVEVEIDPINPKSIKVIKDSEDAAKLNKQIAEAQNKLIQKNNNTVETSKLIKIEPDLKNDRLPLITKIPPTTTTMLNPVQKIQLPTNLNSLGLQVQHQSQPPTNKTIISNGNVFIIEKSKLNQQTKQESLLKPQISLLKPLIKSSQQLKSDLTVKQQLITQKPSCLSQNVQRKELILNTTVDIKNIELLTPKLQPPLTVKSSIKNGSNHKFIITNIKKGFREELYNNFMERKFIDINNNSICSAVEYLLKKVPLIHEFVQKYNEYVECFPFVVNSIDTFNQLILPKQRYYEWCRAKFIKKMLIKHNDLKELPMWSTKELIIFARKFNYTPQISRKIHLFGSEISTSSIKTNKNDQNQNNNLTKLIQQEFHKEKIQCGQIITLNSKINTFINIWNRNTFGNYNKINDNHDEINEINIVDNFDDETDKHSNIKKISSRKNVQNEQLNENYGKIIIPIDTSVQLESKWIANVCDTAKINIAPEEIDKGIIYPTAQRLLIQVAQSFIEDLIRKTSGNKFEYELLSDKINETAILPSDIIRTVKTVERFDFLTNKSLGVLELKSEKQ